jgi:hypothetical protein
MRGLRLAASLAKEGVLRDKSSEIITAALRRAAAEPAGLPLHGSRSQRLFAESASGRKAAQLCKSEGYLQIVRTESRGRKVRELCAVTEKGLAYLLSQVSPKQVLEDLVRALHSQQAQVGEMLATVRHWQASIDACKTLIQKVLHKGSECAWGMGSGNGKASGAGSESVDRTASLHFAPALPSESMNPAGAKRKQAIRFPDSPYQPSPLPEAILAQLHHWRETDAAGDCPLPELFRRVGQNSLTIGQFHDQLRALQEQEQIYLHPWTGPLPEIPEPALALLAGHGIAYYASIR